jgi:hypothetical protein
MLVVRFHKFLFLFIFLLLPFLTHAIVINEIMYDLDGADSGREWIEIFNNSNESVNLENWRFYEAETNHKLKLFLGEVVLIPGAYLIIADNPGKFLLDWPAFIGTIFDSTFSLSNTGETLIIRNGELVDVDTVSYISDMGANGDENSLQKINRVWVAASPTPGIQNITQQSTASSASTSGIDADVPSQSQQQPQSVVDSQPESEAKQESTAVIAVEPNKKPEPEFVQSSALNKSQPQQQSQEPKLKTKSAEIVGSKPTDAKADVKHSVLDTSNAEKGQLASVAGAEQDNFLGSKKWLILAIFSGVFGAAGLILIRRQGLL